MPRLRACMLAAALGIAPATLPAQAGPQYVALPLSTAPASGCHLATSRAALAATLKDVGYKGALPAIRWDQGAAAVVVTSNDGKIQPFRYVAGPVLRIEVMDAAASTGHYLYVMEVHPGAATGCTLAQMSFQMISGPRGVTSAEPTRASSGSLMVKGSAAGDAAHPK